MASSRFMTVDKSVFLDERREVFAIGDIHGDMDALIICLRDCCKVIKKKDGFSFDKNNYDNNLRDEMLSEGDYVKNLNYEWIGRDKIIVLTGDLLDGYRLPNIYRSDAHIGEYPYEEAKILIFLREMLGQAKRNNCEILLILGNHEFTNIFGDDNKYISRYALDTIIPYRDGTYNRENFFKYDNPGAKLLGFSGYRFFVVINNILFIHSCIPVANPSNYDKMIRYGTVVRNLITRSELTTHEQYMEISNFINSRDQSDYDAFENRHLNYDHILSRNSYPSDIAFDDDKYIKERDQARRNEEFCTDTNRLINNFCTNRETCGTQNILVVGHTVQSDHFAYRGPFQMKIFSEVVPIERTATSTEYVPSSTEHTVPFVDVNTDTFEFDNHENYKMIPGINVECLHENPNYASIYKIDVGMSRAFDVGIRLTRKYISEFNRVADLFNDFPEDATNSEGDAYFIERILPTELDAYNNERVYNNVKVNDDTYFSEFIFTLMRSRCPAVLHIKFEPEEKITVIRSTLRNTLIHQPRPNNIDYPEWMINEFFTGDFRLDSNLQ